MLNENHALTRLASQLGYAGLLPFVAGAALAWMPVGTLGGIPAHWPLLSYAAVILAFMGAIHWGLAMHAETADRAHRLQLILSIVPSLVAWIALALPVVVGYPVLALAFVVLLYGDARAVAWDLVPKWYAQMRGPLTFGALITLIIAWAGAMFAV